MLVRALSCLCVVNMQLTFQLSIYIYIYIYIYTQTHTVFHVMSKYISKHIHKYKILALVNFANNDLDVVQNLALTAFCKAEIVWPCCNVILLKLSYKIEHCVLFGVFHCSYYLQNT